jgi:hypothetical protein
LVELEPSQIILCIVLNRHQSETLLNSKTLPMNLGDREDSLSKLRSFHHIYLREIKIIVAIFSRWFALLFFEFGQKNCDQ